MDPVSVGLPGAGARDEPVPDPVVVIGQPDPGLRSGAVEQAHLDGLRDPGSHREVGSPVARRRPQGRRPAGKCIRHPENVTGPAAPDPRLLSMPNAGLPDHPELADVGRLSAGRK